MKFIKFKKVSLLLSVAALSLSLIACGGGASETSTDASADSKVETPSEETASEVVENDEALEKVIEYYKSIEDEDYERTYNVMIPSYRDKVPYEVLEKFRSAVAKTYSTKFSDFEFVKEIENHTDDYGNTYEKVRIYKFKREERDFRYTKIHGEYSKPNNFESEKTVVFENGEWGTTFVDDLNALAFYTDYYDMISVCVPREFKQDFAMGENILFEDGGIFTVNGFRTSEGAGYSKPEEGNEFLIIDMSFANLDQTEISFSSMMNFNLLDAQGNEYSQELGGDVYASFDGTALPGHKLRGEIVYEVPKDLSAMLYLNFNPMFEDNLEETNIYLSGPDVVEAQPFVLSKAPGIQIGETVELSDRKITVNSYRTSKKDVLNRLSENHTYLVVNLTMENNSDEEFNSGVYLEFEAIDDRGYSHSRTVGGDSDSGFMDGIPVGESRTADVVFEIPEDAKHVGIQFKAMFSEDDTQYFEIIN